MRILNFIVVTLLATTSLAVNRPEPPRPETRRSGELPARVREQVESFNRTAREIFGSRVGQSFELRLPEGLRGNQVNRYERDLTDLAQLMRSKEAEFSRDANKANDVANLIMELNTVYTARPSIQRFQENARLEGENARVVENTIELIDNMMTIIHVKVNETAEAPVSHGQILRVMQTISSLPRTNLRLDDLINLEAQVTGILPRDYNMAKAARCVK